MTEEKRTCMNCTKKKCSLLEDLGMQELTALNQNRYEVSYKTGETICKQGTKAPGLICLYKGKVKMTKMGLNGKEQIVGLKKPVDFIGFRALMAEKNFQISAVALEDSSVCIIEKSDFFSVVKKNPALVFKIMEHFAEKLDEADTRIVNLTQKHVRARLAEALLLLYDVFGVSSESGALDVLLKRSDLADLANMTTANSIRVLSAFAKEKVVDVDGRTIKIIDLKALKKISLYGG